MKGTAFITCLGDTFYPDIVAAMRRVLDRFDIETTCPTGQTCCGQPMFNAGYFKDAAQAARHFVEVFEPTEGPIISPSASCTAMVREHYPKLFKDDPVMQEKVKRVGVRSFEFSEYLFKELKINLADHKAVFDDSVTFHQSCHFRHLGITSEPVDLMKQIDKIDYRPLTRIDQCCGFGGTFSVNYPHISQRMVADKVQCILDSGANWLVFADAGCAMNITGYANKIKKPLQSMHIAELIDQALGGAA